MTAADLIAHVDQSIERALRGESPMDPSVLDIKGFATPVQRHLVSNLAHLPKPDPVYLEVGLYAGATFCAAISNNPTLMATGYEDFTQPFGDDSIRKQLDAAFDKHEPNKGSVYMVYGNCFTSDPSAIQLPVDLYYYDGEHSRESQAKALPHFIDQMADTFIMMTDDFSWEPVLQGTTDGFAVLDNKIKIEKRWLLTDGVPNGERFHNDIGLFVISKV